MDDRERPFGVWTAAAMVVGGMIGAGIFVLPAALAPVGLTSVAAWVAAGLGVLAIGSVIARLTAERPQEPSVLATCGDILGLLPGRLLAWSYWATIVVSVPVLAMTAAAYLLHIFPSQPQGPWERALAGTAIVALLVFTNLRGVRAAGYLQVTTTVLKLLPLAVVMGIVGWLLVSEPATFSESTVAPVSLGQLTPALAIAFFAMLSFENAGLVAGRVRDPARNVVRATLFGLALVLAIYLVVSTGIILAIPAGELQAQSAPVAMFVARFVGPWAGDVTALFAAISAIGCLNALVMLLGEMPRGLVRDGQLPEWMAPANSRGVGASPLVAGCMLGVALMLASATAMGELVLDFLLRLTTASAIWFYVGICLAGLVAGAKRATAVAGLAFCGWVFYGTGLEAGSLSIVLLLAGIPLHYLVGPRTRPRNTVPAT